ncbi:MAG: hypothetical protein PWP23_3156 [Candidatus Sumerlaeota bacterium]|nr:hypothetical protein [Candidatus Sumerlaeota bacterium]
MRTVVTAMEAYAVDNNKYPYWTYSGSHPAPAGVTFTTEERWKFYPGYAGYSAGLTTPIAYITGASAMEDIFRLPHNFPQPLANQMMYLSTDYYAASPATYAAQDRRYGKWVLRSAGPDTYYQNYMHLNGDYDAGGWFLGSYDATNGTVSAGDIYRSQKNPDETHT